MSRIVYGCMTGTSLDGIDCAAMEIHGHGLALSAQVVGSHAEALGDLAAPLRAFAEGAAFTAGEITDLSRRFSLAIAGALSRLRTDAPTLACVHGQTVFHHAPESWQLLNPAIIAQELACPVLSDLRAADLAAGGQGAPMTPIADAILFGQSHEARMVINLGGFINVTELPSDPTKNTADIQGYDLCPCNQALNLVARRAFDAPFDEGGERALSAFSHQPLVEELMKSVPDRKATRSLGSLDTWQPQIDRAFENSIDADRIARSITTSIGRLIAERVPQQCKKIILAGGGAHNAALVTDIAEYSSVDVIRSSECGIGIVDREAVAMAILGALSVDGVPITLPQITGCQPPAPLAGIMTLHPELQSILTRGSA